MNEYDALIEWSKCRDTMVCYRSFQCGCVYEWRELGGIPVVPLICPSHNDNGHGSLTVAVGFRGPWNVVPYEEWAAVPQRA